MADMPTPSGETSCSASDPIGTAAIVLANRAAPTSTVVVGESSETIELLEETLAVSKRRKATGRVRITTHTETVEALAEVELDRYRVEVTRVPVGRVVDVAPVARAEGDTTIIPVIEERYVVVKQLVLVEEVHVRHVLERETVSEPVTLRRQRAVVERLDPGDEPAADE
ncbi:MAG: YsnF/AvaK domain-containing protein [Janthinobacterium lividum]